MSTNGRLRAVTAFDNFDRFIETTGQKLTMNDTVGILAQDIDDSRTLAEIDLDTENSSTG